MKPTVLLFGDDPTGPTGFGKIVAYLIDAVVEAGGTPVVVPLKSIQERENDRARVLRPPASDPKGWDTVARAVRDEGASMVVTVGDPWDLHGLVDVQKAHPFFWIGCTPVDSTPYPRFVMLTKDPQQYLDVAFLMQHINRIVTFSDFGRAAVTQMLADAHAPGQPQQGPIEHIYLGVDSEMYTPGDRSAARHVFEGAVDDTVLLFSCIKVNSMRAGFDTLLAAWRQYLDRAHQANPAIAQRSRLYLHTVVQGQGYPIPLLMQRFGVAPSLLLNPALRPGEGVPTPQLIDVLRTTDIGLSATRAEGFGLNIIEAMSCATPCIVPNYGAPAEYGGDGVMRAPIAATYTPEFAITDFAIVDVDRMAEMMLELALDETLRTRMADAARTRACELSWGLFIERWAQIIGAELASL